MARFSKEHPRRPEEIRLILSPSLCLLVQYKIIPLAFTFPLQDLLILYFYIHPFLSIISYHVIPIYNPTSKRERPNFWAFIYHILYPFYSLYSNQVPTLAPFFNHV